MSPALATRTGRSSAWSATGACRVHSRWAPLLHAPAHALPTGRHRADSVAFWIRAERRGAGVSPCGVVKWFDPDRGIGVISQEGAGPDVQAEALAIRDKDGHLRQGEEVLFDVTLDSAGLRADDIHRPVRGETRPERIEHGGQGVCRTWPCPYRAAVSAPRRQARFPCC
ncbi:cold-shock protein [Streptomyces sp. CB00455]|uniref:cold-shock protein n=1 Tax=Streptomyces sp. CB00455 TaxID=1703927 RepID=UPI003FD57F79